MTVASISALVFGVFSPNSLYTRRDIVGKLERRMHRVDNPFNPDFPMLSPCFSPLRYIQDTTSTKLRNFAENLVWFRMKNRALFNDCLMLISKNKQYISAAAKSKNIQYSEV